MDKTLLKLFTEAQKNADFHRKTDYFPFLPPKMKAWHRKEKKMFEVLNLDLYKQEALINMLHKKGSWKVPTQVSFEDIDLLPQAPLKISSGEDVYFGDYISVSEETYKLFQAVGWEKEDDEYNPMLYIVMYRPDLKGWGSVDIKNVWYVGGNPYYAHATYLWLIDKDKKSTVVGNMFENPELLLKSKANYAE